MERAQGKADELAKKHVQIWSELRKSKDHMLEVLRGAQLPSTGATSKIDQLKGKIKELETEVQKGEDCLAWYMKMFNRSTRCLE